MSTVKNYSNCSLEFWGGIECTINRVGDSYFDQLELSGHYNRGGDIKLIADLGIKVLRFPILWEKHQPQAHTVIDWSYTTQRLEELSENGITPIAGLLHHGSGPEFTDLLDEKFPEKFASYAAKVAQQFPQLEYYTPINEPLTTARFSGLYGLWFPHISNDISFARMLINQVKGTILAMREIKKINPRAKLVQTEDISKTYCTPLLTYQASFENERRWLTYDLLCGKVKPSHAMWKYFERLGVNETELNFFIENPLPPDIAGFNYYITSERFLDDDLSKYPPPTHGGNEIQEYADVEAIRVCHGNPSGLKVLLAEAWQRYRLPIAITEAHLNAGREDQLRWLYEIYISCCEARESGIDIKALTFWSLFGAYGWSKLLTGEHLDYEPGAFDLRSAKPRPTGIASLIKNIINGNNNLHLLMDGKGWWHHIHRYYNSDNPHKQVNRMNTPGRPLLITGKAGALGPAFGKMCEHRDINYLLPGEDELDITDEKDIKRFLERHNPWAIINTAGLLKVEDAERRPEDCFNVNTNATCVIAKACRQRGIAYAMFSSDLVFDGRKALPYLETDLVAPLNIYGAAKAMAEVQILTENPSALIIRSGAFFGPWDNDNFVGELLNSLAAAERFIALQDVVISPTYLPHLAAATLELLIDQESGTWHLANDGALTWKQFAEKIADRAGFDPGLIEGVDINEMQLTAALPKNSALASAKGKLMPSLNHAIDCYFDECITLPATVLKLQQREAVL